MAFDGGSGFNFWLPHLAAKDVEGPSKMLDKICIGEAACRWVAVHRSVNSTQDMLINNIRD
jgi:hypothetical protein